MAKRKPSKQKTYQRDTNAWKDACKALLERIISRPDSEPFRRPVDLAEISDYTTVIAEAMDFGTIRQKLFNGLYGNVSEFNDDCKLVFANSKAYNTNKRSRVSRFWSKHEWILQCQLELANGVNQGPIRIPIQD
jgi:hypothetical protein